MLQESVSGSVAKVDHSFPEVAPVLTATSVTNAGSKYELSSFQIQLGRSQAGTKLIRKNWNNGTISLSLSLFSHSLLNLLLMHYGTHFNLFCELRLPYFSVLHSIPSIIHQSPPTSSVKLPSCFSQAVLLSLHLPKSFFFPKTLSCHSFFSLQTFFSHTLITSFSPTPHAALSSFPPQPGFSYYTHCCHSSPPTPPPSSIISSSSSLFPSLFYVQYVHLSH